MTHNLNTIQVQTFPDGRLNTKNAALYLGISEKTLAMYRCQGTSPKFIKKGNRVFYFKQDLDAWLNDDEAFTSTAQARLRKENKDA